MADAAPKPERAKADTPNEKPDSKKAPKRRGKGQSKAAKAAKDAEHFALVMEAAQATVQIFTKEGIPCASFGSLAAKLYGSARCPNDVDLLIYQDPLKEDPWSAEGLKKLLLDRDPRHFYLTMPKDPAATYRVLWYRQSYLGLKCKVDVLIPGTMHLPNMPPSHSVLVNGVPLVPFSLLLLHKLQGWDDHRSAEQAHKRAKLPQDVADIKRLLEMESFVTDLVKAKPWSDRVLFTEEFEELTKARVKDFCQASPKLVARWRSLGFQVPDPPVGVEKEKKGQAKGVVAAAVDEAAKEEVELLAMVQSLGITVVEDHPETRKEHEPATMLANHGITFVEDEPDREQPMVLASHGIQFV